MSPTISRRLPALVALLVFGTIALRCAQEPRREEAQGQITGLIAGSDLDRAGSLLTTYLERFTNEEDHWFAAEAWFGLHQPEKAIEEIWGHPELANQPGTAHRFAETGLLALGWSDLAHRNPTSLEPHTLITLVEGGHPWASEHLHGYAATLPLRATVPYFFGAYRRATRRPLDVMVTGYRTREDEKFAVAAALAALNEADYPQKADDIAVLQHVLLDGTWREQWLDVWAVSAVALGRSGDAAALRTLHEVAAGLEGRTGREDRKALLLIRNGILAGGDWSVAGAQLEAAQQKDAHPMPTIWLLEALIHRYRVGDMRAEPGLVMYWTQLGQRFPAIRSRIARALLLQDAPPTPEAQAQWVGRMLADLERPDAPFMSHVLAYAWRLRDGAPEDRQALLQPLIEALRTAGAAFSGASGGSSASDPFLEALRALYLYA